jgi:hypothetical protein
MVASYLITGSHSSNQRLGYLLSQLNLAPNINASSANDRTGRALGTLLKGLNRFYLAENFFCQQVVLITIVIHHHP